jgi:drug/metabolite transporter (DMT)-like permease
VDVRRLRAGEWLAAAAAILLIVSLLLPWYDTRSGFETLSVIDILLVLVAGVALALAILQATQTSPALPVAFSVLTVTAGLIGVLLVLFRLIDAPGSNLDVAAGAWLGLAAVAALTAGGWLSLANEHARHLPPGPEPELRPAPGGS